MDRSCGLGCFKFTMLTSTLVIVPVSEINIVPVIDELSDIYNPLFKYVIISPEDAGDNSVNVEPLFAI
jgi:hypothetical protein